MKISLILFLQSVAYRFGLKNAISNPRNGRGRGVIAVHLGYRGIYFQLDYRGIQGNHDGASSTILPPLPLVQHRYPFSSAIEPRQCEQWPRRSGVTHAPLNIVADKGAGDVLQTAMRHAPHPPPVKTFRTAAPVCHDDGVSHVSPFVFPETALGNYEVPDATFGNYGARRIDYSVSWDITETSEFY